ncbi:MAG: DivIVA domain-containing protein [Oscillospiraceae bacterium]|jgi:cell division initiation protein|nr:DivIVA domain-containing protein [Oscillospiraceae bacterium]
MLTPQNFREKTFERAVFGGYDMASVDDFLEESAKDYESLAKENHVLKSKMKVLVEKIEEYRATEDSMRMTLLSVQKLSTQIEQDAKEKAESILAEAEQKVELITREAHNQRIAEEARLVEARRESGKYIEAARAACERQLKFLISLGAANPAPTPAAAPEIAPRARVDETIANISASVERESADATTGEEVRRTVLGAAGSPVKASEPTRLFGSVGGQVSLDSFGTLHK